MFGQEVYKILLDGPFPPKTSSDFGEIRFAVCLGFLPYICEDSRISYSKHAMF